MKLFDNYSIQRHSDVLDVNKKRTYKNITQTAILEAAMTMTFLKDLMAFVALGAFGVAALTWVDVLSRLV